MQKSIGPQILRRVLLLDPGVRVGHDGNQRFAVQRLHTRTECGDLGDEEAITWVDDTVAAQPHLQMKVVAVITARQTDELPGRHALTGGDHNPAHVPKDYLV